MGWWEVTTMEEKRLLMSDEAADVLGDAFDRVSEIYQRNLGRKPTRNEIRYAVEFTLPTFLQDNLDTD